MKNFLPILAAAFLAATTASAFTIYTQPTNQAAAVGGTAIFVVVVTNPGPFFYQWQFNGTNLTNGLISTAAGNGVAALAGDGGPAVSASLYSPYGVAVDKFGNYFIADTLTNRIRKVTATNNIIATVAGGGVGGDGSSATLASLNNPFGVTVDTNGNFFIADYSDQRIRKVGTNNLISTVAGSGLAGFAGDGSAATSAQFTGPADAALDSVGNIYIADVGNNRIRKVGTNGIISTVAGSGPNNGSPGTFGGDGGAATNANLYYPHGVAVDATGNLFIADTYNHRIRKVGTNGIISSVAGTNSSGYSGDGGPAVNAKLDYPASVAVDAIGNLYIADSSNNRVRKVATNGVISTVAGGGLGGDGGQATNASLTVPQGVALDTFGNLLIADTGNYRLRKVYLGGAPALMLNNVTTNMAGNYQVIVTNASGSVTSSVAKLTVQQFIPLITSQPQPQSLPIGGTARFTVGVNGVAPLAYQWYFGNSPYTGGTNATLTFGPVLTNYAGNYLVIVTNVYGSATSSPALLTVLLQPNEYGISVSNKAIILKLASTPGSTNRLWFATNLNTPVNWQAIATNIAGTNGLYQVADTNTAGRPIKFYRTSNP